MKKEYQRPECDLVRFNATDIVRTSGLTDSQALPGTEGDLN